MTEEETHKIILGMLETISERSYKFQTEVFPAFCIDNAERQSAVETAVKGLDKRVNAVEKKISGKDTDSGIKIPKFTVMKKVAQLVMPYIAAIAIGGAIVGAAWGAGLIKDTAPIVAKE